jgi:hypothetical protein
MGTVMDSFHWAGNSSLFQTELMNLWFHVLLESGLSEFDHYLVIYPV